MLLGLLSRNPDRSGLNFSGKITRINQALERLYPHSERYYRDIGLDLVDENGRVSEKILPDELNLNHHGYQVVGTVLKTLIEELW